jgi:fermentation-respiration switch protein FrsA (DUF1100 family)
VRRVILIVGLVVVGLYLAALTYVGLRQREMMYFPEAVERAPHVAGVDIEVVRLTTPDGERLIGWWSPPAPGQPTILFFDGNAGTLTIQEGRWRRIHAAGVGFFAPAYRGYSGSSGHPTEAGLHIDARTAYAWLVQRVPAKDIVIQGHSLGSGVAVQLAAEKSCRALILESPYVSTVAVASERFPLFPVSLVMQDQFRSDRFIGKVHVPVLVVHGDRDSVIPFAHGPRLFAMANQPKTFVRMPGSEHSTLVVDGMYDHIFRFLGVSGPTSKPQ